MKVSDVIKSKLDIVDIISAYVSLEKSGRFFKGLCPFHSEKQPSFIVNPEKQSFHCYGCHAGGDIFSFVMQMQKISFSEALSILSKKAGIDIQADNGPDSIKVKRLYDLNKVATNFLHRELLNSPKALNYLQERGVDIEMIKKYKIGYTGRSLVSHLLANNFSSDEIICSGVGRKGENGNIKNVFFDRIMLPIYSDGCDGEVRGFIGRSIGDSGLKYINGPSTSIFNKGEVLFMLDSSEIKSKGEAIVVEGAFDALMCHKYGFTNTVSPLGTAFTERHLEFLRRYSNRIIVAFDGDKAGVAAQEKIAKMMFDLHAECFIATLPPGEDPDSFLRRYGKEAFKEIIDDAIPVAVFLARLPAYRRTVFIDLLQRSSLQVAEFLAYSDTIKEVELKMFSHLSSRDFVYQLLKQSPVVFRINKNNKLVEIKKHGKFLVLFLNREFVIFREIVGDYKKEAVAMSKILYSSSIKGSLPWPQKRNP